MLNHIEKKLTITSIIALLCISGLGFGTPGHAPTPPKASESTAAITDNVTSAAPPTSMTDSSPSTQPASGWKYLAPSDANIGLNVPANSKYATTTTSSLVGDVINHTYTGDVDGTTVVLDYTKIPGVAFIFTGDESLYSQAKESYLHDMLAKQTDFEERHYSGIDGRHLGFTSPKHADHNGYVGQAFFFFRHHTLYIVSVYSKNELTDQQAEQIFHSIKSTGKVHDDG